MIRRELQHELDRLLGGLCDGTLTAANYSRLDELLQCDDEARRFYNNYMFLHAALYSEHAAVGAVAGQEQRVEGHEPELLQLASRVTQRGELKSPSRPRLAVAAALVGVAAVSSWVTYLAAGGARPQAAVAAVDGEVSQAVARITATRNCLWQSDTAGIGFGTRLHPGQRLELAAGLVEVTFDDGATVVLEGPATFEIGNKSANGFASDTRRQRTLADPVAHLQLHVGRLAAIVPPQARGFAVGTLRLNVVDLGTEFGLMAESQGATEIHVFNGLVKAQLLDERGAQVRTVELNTAEAARIQPASAMVARIPARHEEFVRSLSVASGPHDGLFAYDGFNYPAGPLADQNGGFGWAGPWSVVESDAVLGHVSDAAVGGVSDADSSIGLGEASHLGFAASHANGVKSGSLDYEGLVPVSNHAAQTAEQNRIRRVLSTSIGGVFDAANLVENQDGMRLVGRDGTTVYLSFLQRVNKTNDVFYGFELHRSDGNANRVLCIGHGAEGTTYGATSNYNIYGPRNFPALGQEDTTTNFFVIRITFGMGNRDRVEVFRNPESLADESACLADAELTGNFAFDRISLGNFHGTKLHEVDEIRVGTTFRAVTGRRSRGPDRLMPHVAAEEDWRTELAAQAF